jgi:hypothetical protein
MTKEFMDVDFFVREASNRTQRDFELDFAYVIEVYDTNSVTLTTEDGRELTISWYPSGYFQSYHVVPLTQKMGVHPGRVVKVIDIL